MAKKRNKEAGASEAQPKAPKPAPTLPRRALERIHLGQTFAENDKSLKKPELFVRTPALNAALDPDNPRCFFVGRRGTGKTTIVRYVEQTKSNILSIRPEIFSPGKSFLPVDEFEDMHQKPFKSLLNAFRRSIQDEVFFASFDDNIYVSSALPSSLYDELSDHGQYDFDVRTVRFIANLTRALKYEDDATWLTEQKATKALGRDLSDHLDGASYTVLIDAIDDYWDGSKLALFYLTALMHAVLEINSQLDGIRVLVFLRENMFERVRSIDPEFSRLESSVVGLDWTKKQLIEMVERRINVSINPKIELNGPTWTAFFEDGRLADEEIFTLCQTKPRDVLTYCSLALETAQANSHSSVMIDDLQAARRRFSDSRLKDLSDEYQENYPQIGLVLSRFYGQGQRYTLGGIEDFLVKLMEDNEILFACKEWIYARSTPESLIRLFYDIGFVGLQDRRRGRGDVTYRSAGPRDTTPPPVSERVDVIIHPTYRDALDLQDTLMGTLGDLNKRPGLIFDLPNSLSLPEYQDQLQQLDEELKTLPTGLASAAAFEDIVGQVIKLCLFRPLNNVEEQVRNVNGTVRRDWMASNRATSGFWELIRTRYAATQVLFECKNYEDLSASDFHQSNYYINNTSGRFIVIVHRGDFNRHYYEHIQRIAKDKDGMVLILNDKDLRVFIRQSINGKVKDEHLQDKYDNVIRYVS